MTATTLYTPGVISVSNPLTGAERVLNVDNGSAQGIVVTTGQIAGLTTVKAQVYNTSALAASGTLTAANITGGTDTVYLGMTGAFAGAANIQLPLYSAVEALTIGTPTSLLGAGSSYVLRIINPSAQTLTLTTNTGWTLNGTATIPTLSFRDFLVTLTNATGGVIQDVGSAAAAAQ